MMILWRENSVAGAPDDPGIVRTASFSANNHLPGWLVPALVFLFSYLILFLGMSRRPYVYDEGLVLTAAMRVAAGQIPHRDFYANYGPAQFYTLAGLFKIFGQSLLVERLVDLLIKSLLVALIYAVAASCCRRWIAASTSLLAILWLIGLHDLVGTPVIPVSLLNLIGLALLLPVFRRNLPARRLFAAGAVAGLAFLFRYDTGVALCGVQVCTIALAIYLRRLSSPWQDSASALWPLLLGFATVTLPAAFYFVSVAPFASFVHDLIVYPAKYYRHSRNLPFPGIHLKRLENLGIYLPIVLAVLSLFVAFRHRPVPGRNSPGLQDSSGESNWRGVLVTFALLTVVMYLKGFVRVGLGQLYLSIIPSLLLLAVLVQNWWAFARPGRISVICLACLFVVAGTWSAVHQAISLYRYHLSVPFSARLAIPEIQQWCKTRNPLTIGFCFLPENERIQTIEFIDSHTRPDQQLYVGTTKHDRIYANDNILYFATQRLPATHWSHFDPGLQNSSEIQQGMVSELDASAPPYIVLDREFDRTREPNDSSKSSGVTLLDDYIQKKYQPLQRFGDLTVWQRTGLGSSATVN